jgi:hypothetical protein
MNRPMTNRKPNWIKACEDTQKKLESFERLSNSWREQWDSLECAFCNLINATSCDGCPIAKASQPHCGLTDWYKKLKYHPTIPHILALWLWLEDLKGMLGRGEI